MLHLLPDMYGVITGQSSSMHNYAAYKVTMVVMRDCMCSLPGHHNSDKEINCMNSHNSDKESDCVDNN